MMRGCVKLPLSWSQEAGSTQPILEKYALRSKYIFEQQRKSKFISKRLIPIPTNT